MVEDKTQNTTRTNLTLILILMDASILNKDIEIFNFHIEYHC